MDIKDFIKETISGIVEAAHELHAELDSKSIYINPPRSVSHPGLFDENSPAQTHRQIQEIEFDIAVTASSDTKAGGKAGLRILEIGATAEGAHSRASEEVSRVKFTIPVTFSPSTAEANSRAASERQRMKMNAALENKKNAKRGW
ncbi:hypothetical protein KO491_03875 [Roseovarius nubinhibens]|uniref:trypco2 family protein n=1 Tax=Roseovarius nubinhibens TaxID=314263 RepID=UPI001C0A5615|nr:trypco2 family protein [Roseovarius nubinhibens]MBU2998965.1 hypothetical protein [Roseovarius nubinhibens]